jgi:hypothetical protein
MRSKLKRRRQLIQPESAGVEDTVVHPVRSPLHLLHIFVLMGIRITSITYILQPEVLLVGWVHRLLCGFLQFRVSLSLGYKIVRANFVDART